MTGPDAEPPTDAAGLSDRAGRPGSTTASPVTTPVPGPASDATAAGVPPVAPVPDADAVALAALAVPDVTALHGGEYGEVATYLPGRRVIGVRTRPGRAEVHVVVTFGPNVARVADRVRESILRAVPTCGAVDVVIADLADQPLEPAW
ncbi:MAG: hypothetical protein ACQSGP_10075 [Frankia sp.]